jgi:ABC-2 type transport system permease protein
MEAELELQRLQEGDTFRGFSTLLRKENRAWWATRRWWVNAVIWVVLLSGLQANMLFVPTIANLATEADIARAGGLNEYVVSMGLNVLFEFGTTVVAIGAVVLSMDACISERESGVCPWLLSRPAARRSYVLAKLASSLIAMLVLLIGIPSLVGYGMLSMKLGSLFPPGPFLAGLGLMILHVMFYLTLTVTLGVFFTNRIPVLALALGSVLGGSLVGGLIRPLLHVTPWMLPKLASLAASGQYAAVIAGASAIIASALWCVVFAAAALWKFERMDL